MNATTPAQCSAAAVKYGFSGQAWVADRALIPNAQWIWRGDTVPTGAANQGALFERSFNLGPNPSGTLYIAADDFAEVLVNGVLVGSTGSMTDQKAAERSQSKLSQLVLTAHLRQGRNQISIRAQNGPFQCTASACTYANAPAGVVFGGVLENTCPAK